MFLHYLNEREREAFLLLARDFVEVDGAYTQDEMNMMESFARELGVATKEIPSRPDPSERESLFRIFSSRTARSTVLLELLALAYADQNFCEKERSFLEAGAKIFDLEEEELRLMEDWVVRQLALYNEAYFSWMRAESSAKNV
ncbi:MAG: hypothetical protein H6727_19705 [Myxococcales bacterium]|nr:hypothetical protein [Myxococcales bacterium]